MKKILAFIVSLLLVFTLVGCGNDYDFKSRFDLVFADVNVAAVENNIQLPTKAGNLMFEWESSNPDVISNDGIVKRAKEDVKVTLKAVMTYQGQTEELSIEVTVKGIGEVALAKNTIKEACEGATGEYEVSGTVVAFNAQSFLIQDETGVIMSFHGNGFTKDVKVGDVVLLTGTTTVYGASTQFKNATYSIVASEEVKHPTQKEYTAAELDALCEANADDKSATFKPEYVKVKGVVEISGNFFNVKIDGAAKAVGSLVYPVNTDEYTALNGKEIEVNAYLTGVTGPGRYLQLMVVDYTVLGDGGGNETPVDPSVKTIAEIVAGDNGSYITEGTVVGTNAQSFLIQDETGIIMVYCGKSYAKDLVIGDKVKVNGTTTVYGAAKQFNAGSTYEKTGKGTVNRGEAVALTVAELDAYATMEAIAPKFVKVTGEVAVSGSYFNLNIEGTSSVVGSLVYPVDADALTALNGKELEVYAYLTGLTGTKYLQLVVVEYKEVEGTGTVDPVDPA
ncbi:MAG: hypothetical protein IJD46_02490, partial [Bacilli bacterium]|nr:hypothetical protein [Bacilli bacterium]